MKNRLAALQQKLDGAITAFREHSSLVVADSDLEAHDARTASLKAAMDRASAAVSAERDAIEAERLVVADGALIVGGEDRKAHDQKGGFNSFGEFARAVHSVATGNGSDNRLRFDAAAPTTYGRESVGADGGYLVPAEFGRTIWQHSLDEGSFVPLTNNFPVSGNSMTFPRDETTPWGTNGVRAYWQGEGVAATQTKPVLGEMSLRLKRLTALVPVTDELISDALAVPQYISQLAGKSIAWKVNNAIVNGSGVGEPLGFVNAGSLVTITKKSGQTAATIVAENVSGMFGRVPRVNGSSRWLINHDAWAQLPTLSVGQMPVFLPDFQTSPDGVLMGLPVVKSQVCATLGTTGDIYLANFSDYVTITKAGGIETATSMHLFFDAHATAFRLTFRIDGQPWYSSAISPANGSASLSGFVTVETRS